MTNPLGDAVPHLPIAHTDGARIAATARLEAVAGYYDHEVAIDAADKRFENIALVADMSDDVIACELPLLTRRAVSTVRRTEQLCISLEEQFEFGRERLLRTVNRVEADYARDHIRRYRQLIRTNEWPNTVLGICDEAFLDRYERAALAYVATGFRALTVVRQPDVALLADVHRAVLSSEALRGQYGKSSPDGLDRRLERCEEDLLEHLDDEDQLILLGTLPRPLLTAEDNLVRDFATMRAVTPEAPSLDEVLSMEPEAAEAVWVFLRRRPSRAWAHAHKLHKVPKRQQPRAIPGPTRTYQLRNSGSRKRPQGKRLPSQERIRLTPHQRDTPPNQACGTRSPRGSQRALP